MLHRWLAARVEHDLVDLLGDLGMLIDNVVLFANVGLQIVEFQRRVRVLPQVPLDALPVPQADGQLTAIAGEVPEQVVVLFLLVIVAE